MTRADAIVEIVADVVRDRHAVDAVCALINVSVLMATYLRQPAQQEIARHMVEQLADLNGGVSAILDARVAVAELIERG